MKDEEIESKGLFTEEMEEVDKADARVGREVRGEMVMTHGFDEIYGKPTLLMDEDEQIPSARDLQIMTAEITLGKDIDDSDLSPMSDLYRDIWKKIEFEIREGINQGFSIKIDSMEL